MSLCQVIILRRFNSTLRLSNLREILDQREKLIKHRESELDEKVRAEVRGILSTAEEEREERLKLLRKEEERVNDLKEILEKKWNESWCGVRIYDNPCVTYTSQI